MTLKRQKELHSTIQLKRLTLVLVLGLIMIQDFTYSAIANTIQTVEEYHGISTLCFSPDGKMLVSGDTDGIIKLWETKSGQCLQIFRGHSKQINSIDFSPEGTKCVSGSDDGTIRLWDVISGACLRTYEAQRLPVNSVKFSPLNDYIASGDYDGNLKLWDIKHNVCIRTIDAYEDGMGVCSLSISPDGAYIATGETMSFAKSDGIKIWDTKTGAHIKTICYRQRSINSVADDFVMFSPDGSFIAYYKNLCRTVSLWNTYTGELIRAESLCDGCIIHSLCFSKDGTHMALSDSGMNVFFLNCKMDRCALIYKGFSAPIITLSCSAKILAGGNSDGIYLWKISTGHLLTKIPYNRTITMTQ
ncbi:MAG: WD40 repeat domain-containing protein [Candidatus Xenobiia bacterium LiM19]